MQLVLITKNFKQYNLKLDIVKVVILILLLLNIIYNLVTKLVCLFRDSIKFKLIVNKRIAKACKKFT